MSTLTGELRKLADGSQYASFSPDDSQIAFINEHNNEIWLMTANGEQRRLLFRAPPKVTVGSVSWTPDGRGVAYVRRAFGSDPIIEARDVNNAQVSVVATVPRLLGFHWARDGRLFYTQADSTPAQSTSGLWERRTDPQTRRLAGEPRRLTRWTGLRPGEAPSVSADGRRLVLTLGRGEADVYVVEIEAGGIRFKDPRRLTLSNTDDMPTGWLPDGRAVLLNSDRNGSLDVLSQSLSDRDATTRIAGAGDTGDAQVSPDGSWLLYVESPADKSSAKQTAHLMRAPLSGGSSELVLEATRPSTFRPFLCPRTAQAPCVLSEITDTHYVFTAFSPVGGRGREITRMSRLSSVRESGIGIAPSLSRWALSQDGSLIAYMPFSRTTVPMTVLTVSTGLSRQIEMGDLDRMSGFDWMPDGRAILFFQGTLRNTNVFHLPLEGKAQRVLTLPTGAGAPFVSPDGKYLAYSRFTSERNAWLIELPAR